MHNTAFLACLALAALTCCSRQKPLSRDELESKLRLAASIAAEASTFVDYVAQKRATHHYAEGHIEYLSLELTDTAKDLRDAIAPAGAEAQLVDSRKQVDALAAALGQLRRNIDRPDELAREQSQFSAIRNRLQLLISSL